MGLLLNRILRAVVASGDNLGVSKIPYRFIGRTQIHSVFHYADIPSRFVQVATATSAVGEYPFDGTANVFAATASSNATTVQLASDAMGAGGSPLDPTGLGLVIVDGNAKGDFRLISGWANQSIRSVNLVDAEGTARGISGAITTGPAVHYRLGVPCEMYRRVLLKTEFSAAAGSAPTCEWMFSFFDMGVAFDGATARTPFRYYDRSWTVFNMNVTDDSTTGGQQGSYLGVDNMAGVMAKVRLVTAPALGTVSAWACGI